MEFDLCVVGAGMIGSSAARHATLLGQSVCLIGPEEPTERRGHEIFNSHDDESRITGSVAHDSVWATVSVRSIARYRQLEKASGIPFYTETGYLIIHEASEIFRSICDMAKVFAPDAKILTATELAARCPYLAIYNPEINAVFEQSNAGYINPRRLVEVEQKLAQKGGCLIIRDIVKSVVTTSSHRGGPGMKVTTDGGREIVAKKVLLATGAFTEFRPLLPRWVKLDLQPMCQSILFAELSEEDQLKLKSMLPMEMRCNDPPIPEELKHPKDYGCYALPPIKYPDGKVYLKLGHVQTDLEKPLKSPEEILAWYRNPVPEYYKECLKNVLKATFPDLKPISVHVDSCVTVDTPNGFPYIDLVTPQLGLVLGDNGCSALCCDELGRLAAHLVVKGRWDDDATRGAFNTIVKPNAQMIVSKM